MSKTVCGIGINDADYVVQPTINGKRESCPFYNSWKGMLVRCYSKRNHIRAPSYSSCSVCTEWLLFSNFKEWMERQDWAGKQLDKDLLFNGNKVYSPETCIFISQELNKFINDRKESKGNYMAGVCYRHDMKIFRSQCRNPFTEIQERLGHFSDELDAHLAWKRRKHEIAVMLASISADKRIAKALMSRYAD